MKYIFICIALVIGVIQANAINAGLAMSVNSDILSNSKKALINYLERSLLEMSFKKVYVLNNRFDELKLSTVNIDEQDVQVRIEGDKIKVNIRGFEGYFTGKAMATRLFGGFDHYTFKCHAQKGGMNWDFEMSLGHKYVHEEMLPIFQFEMSKFTFNQNKVSIRMDPEANAGWDTNFAASLVSTLRVPFIIAFESSLNLSFKTIANTLIGHWLEMSKGGIGGGTLNNIPALLIQNDIKIPDEVYLDYEMYPSKPSYIEDPRIYGYFKGTVKGVDLSHIDSKYLKLGSMEIKRDGAPFQILMSDRIINYIGEAVLGGSNKLTQSISYEQTQKNQFPLDWTTTALAAGIPLVTEFYDYDIPLTSVFNSRGAPRFSFTKDEMHIFLSMDIDIFLEQDNGALDELLTIKFDDIKVEFDMEIKDMWLHVQWKDIILGDAEVRSRYRVEFQRKDQIQHLKDFFDYSCQMIISWINTVQPENISKFKIPGEVHDVLKINSMGVEVQENYLEFSIDPTFTIKSKEELEQEKREHPRVMMAAPDFNVFDALFDFISTLFSA